MGERIPIFSKKIVMMPRLTHKNVKSIVGSKGLSPLAGFRAQPQNNFAYAMTVPLPPQNPKPNSSLAAAANQKR